jgi:hypothetical protein
MIVAFTAWAAQPGNMFPLMIGKLSQNLKVLQHFG